MSRRFGLTAWGLAAAIIAAGQLASASGWRINHTASLPMGLWRVDRHASTGHGDVVSFCPPDTPVFSNARTHGYLLHGSCPGNYELLLKPVAAVTGDIVTVTPDGISVNGMKLARSRARMRDSTGLPLVPGLTELIPLLPANFG